MHYPRNSKSQLAIHDLPKGDANDANIIVNDDCTQVVCLIDFGDVSYGFRICEVAIAMAYMMLSKQYPLKYGAAVLQGYHDTTPLTDLELNLLPKLIKVRLAVSVTMANRACLANPDDKYVTVGAAIFSLPELCRSQRGQPGTCWQFSKVHPTLPCCRTSSNSQQSLSLCTVSSLQRGNKYIAFGGSVSDILKRERKRKKKKLFLNSEFQPVSQKIIRLTDRHFL